jgi:hypothetical protein
MGPGEGETEEGVSRPTLGLNITVARTLPRLRPGKAVATSAMGAVAGRGDHWMLCVARQSRVCGNHAQGSLRPRAPRRCADVYNVSGVAVDWEIPWGDDLSCWVELWKHTTSVLKLHGKQFAPWITNTGGSDNGPVIDSYDIEYWNYVGIADRFLDMGSYETRSKTNAPVGGPYNRSLAPRSSARSCQSTSLMGLSQQRVGAGWRAR